MVIYISKGIITDEGTLLLSHLWGSIALAQVALHIIRISGLELHLICLTKCTHAMAIGILLAVYCILFLTMHNCASTHM